MLLTHAVGGDKFRKWRFGSRLSDGSSNPHIYNIIMILFDVDSNFLDL